MKAIYSLVEQYPDKCVAPDLIFRKIRAGDRIFISTGCGEPQQLVKMLAEYVESHPKAFFDTEILHVWTLGAQILLRPVKISDEPLIKDFYYSLSDKSIYRRFLSIRRYLPHSELQKHFVIIDYTREMAILALNGHNGHDLLVGMAQYCIVKNSLSAEISIVVRDDFQRKGIGYELLSSLVSVAKSQGLHTFTADILPDNLPVFRMIDKLGLKYERKWDGSSINVIIYLK